MGRSTELLGFTGFSFCLVFNQFPLVVGSFGTTNKVIGFYWVFFWLGFFKQCSLVSWNPKKKTFLPTRKKRLFCGRSTELLGFTGFSFCLVFNQFPLVVGSFGTTNKVIGFYWVFFWLGFFKQCSLVSWNPKKETFLTQKTTFWDGQPNYWVLLGFLFVSSLNSSHWLLVDLWTTNKVNRFYWALYVML